MAVSDFLPFIWIPNAFLCFGFHTFFPGNDRISAVPISYLSSTSPSSQTGGCYNNLAISVVAVLSAVKKSTSTISNLILISQLNHFTFVSALLLPVLRLNLTLPLQFQGLGTRRLVRPYLGGFPTVFYQLQVREKTGTDFLSHSKPFPPTSTLISSVC